jgi:hypothetical protein
MDKLKKVLAIAALVGVLLTSNLAVFAADDDYPIVFAHIMSVVEE